MPPTILNKLFPSNALRAALAIGTPLMMANLLQAQATAEDDEEVIELSPFVLDGSSDMGYYSSQTLAGGRMKSDLKDVATSVQVVTAEMIQDIGATSLEEILVYTTNTDVAGSMSNYTAADAAGDGTLSSEVARQDPGNANRVRGLGSATRTANYYETSIPFDSYNSGRIDINRGANSFLFGLGSPGGIINSNPAQADFRNSTSIDFRVSTENFENNTSLRGSFNVNRVLIDDKLAVRIAVMDGTDEYTQRPAMRETSRRYIAAKFKPFADKQILLRANYESGDIFSVPVDRIAPLETLSTFINDPYGTVFDTPSGRWSHDPFNNITDNNQGVGYLGVDAAGNAVSVANYNKQIKPNGWAIVWDDSLNADGLPTRATHTGWTNARIRRKNPYFDPNNNLTGNTQSGMVRGLRLTDIGGDYQGFNRQGLVDYEIYDFRTNLLTGPLDYYSNDFDRVNVTLEAVSKRGDFGIELGYNREEWIRDSYVGVGTPEISIDNNYTFAQGPNELFGDVNPNYGKLYITGTAANNSLNKDIRETKRATAFAKLDFTEKFENSPLKWLGRHTVTGLYDHNVLDQEQFANRQFIFGNDAGFHLVQANATQYQRQVASLYYISDAHPAAFTDSSFQVSDFRVTGLPSNLSETYPAGYEIPVSFLSMGDAANDLRWNSPVGDERPSVGAFTPEWQPTTGSLIETTVESFALNMQSFLINDLLVANLGWREDTVQLIRNANPPRTDEFVPILDSEGFNLDGIEGDTITENVFSYGLVAKVPNRWLPEGTSLSFHYGDSSNFIPNPGGFDWNGDPVPSSSGSTRELGVTVGLMNNKLVARLNAYKGKVANEPFGGVDDAYKFMSTAYVLRGYQTLFQDQDVYDRDRDGVFDLDLDDDGNLYDPDLDNNGFLDRLEVGGADYVAGDTYMSLADFLIVEQAYSDLVNPWVRETGGLELISGADTADGEPQVTSGNGLWFTLGDTVDLTAEGVEFELTFNPTRNLRLSANVTQQESRQDNVAPRLTELWDQLIAISQATPSAQFVTQGGNKLSTPLRTEAYASNTLQGVWVNSERVGQAYLAARALAGSDNPEVREYRVNLLGNYTFSEGRFKGMNIGGAFRYQDQAAAGYPVITDPVSGFAVKDVFNPHLDETTEYVDFWIGYKRKIFNDKMNWRIQLNIRNLFADKDPLAIQFQPDGSIARVSIPVPRQFSLSNTFSF